MSRHPKCILMYVATVALVIGLAGNAFAVTSYTPDYIGYDDVFWVEDEVYAANRSSSAIQRTDPNNGYNVARSFKAGTNQLGVSSAGSNVLDDYTSWAYAGLYQAYRATGNTQSFQIDIEGSLQMGTPANPGGFYSVGQDLVYSLYAYDGTQWNFVENNTINELTTQLTSAGSMAIDNSYTLNLNLAAGTDFVLGLKLGTGYGSILWGGSEVDSFSNDFFNTMSLTEVTGAQHLNAAPVPGAIWLLASGLIGLAGLRNKRR